MKKPLSLLLLVLLLSVVGSGQTVSTSVRGTVLDPTGAALPNADCSLTNQATSTTLTAKSGADGGFTFTSVLGGTYNLTVRAGGFKAMTTTTIVVSSSEIRSLGNITLQIGEVRDAVSVTAELTTVQTASGEKSGTITEAQVRDIAVKGRDFFALLTTIPGVVDNLSQPRETSTPNSIGGTYINGGREGQKNFTVDGITDVDTGGNNSVHFQPNMDSIAEIKIMTSNYQAEFGRNGGGVITVITKGGSKVFHGTGYDYYRHESLNANNFFNNRTGTPKSPYRYRISGYSLGGPVYIPGRFNTNKDKLFFFWSQEYTGIKKDYGPRFVNMPTEIERRGDFSQSFGSDGTLIPVKDPLTQQPYPGNIVPQDRINKMGQAMLNFFPLPNYVDPDPRNKYSRNYKSTYSGTYPRRDDIIRIDANLWPSVHLYYRYIQDKDEEHPAYGSFVNGSVNYLLSPVAYGQPGKGHVVQMTKVFSPTLVNELIFGKSRNRLYFDVVDRAAIDRSKVGNPQQWFQDSNITGLNYMPNLQFGGQPASVVNASLGNIPYVNYNDLYSFVDNISKVWGGHNLKAGVYIERTGKFQSNSRNYRGAFNFSRDTSNPFDTGNSYSNALTGYFDSYTEATGRLDGNYWFWDVEWFVQDNWRVSKRLTIDLGIRFYHLPPVEDLNRNISTFDPKFFDPSGVPVLYRPAKDPSGTRVAQNPLTGQFVPAPLIGLFVPNTGNPANGAAIGGKDGYPAGLVTNQWLSFSPRIGFAYDVFGNGKTAVRGGFGMFKDRLPMGNTFASSGNPPLTYVPTIYFGNLDTFAQGGGFVGPTSIRMLLGDQKLVTTMNYSIGVQHQVMGTKVDVSYVGGISRHLFAYRNINPIPIYSRFDKMNEDPTRPGTPLPDNFFRPYMGWADLSLAANGYSSNYNSLQISADRRVARGLRFGIAYTRSKTLGVADDDTSTISPYFSARSRNYGPLAYDRPNVFVLNYNYELPKFGTRLNVKPAKWMLDGWEISGITSFISGSPFTPALGLKDGADLTGSAEGARITVVGDPNLPKSERNFYRNFRTEAFARTAPRDFGNAGVNILRGPGVNNWDISITKKVPLGSETRWIQFRTEMFNTWNHTQFSGMDTSTTFDVAGNQTNPNFGVFNAARNPRQLQFSLKVFF